MHQMSICDAYNLLQRNRDRKIFKFSYDKEGVDLITAVGITKTSLFTDDQRLNEALRVLGLLGG